MDKSWINKPRNNKEYLDGVHNFIKFGMDKSSLNGKILCPCRKCVNSSSLDPKIVEEHLVWNGFVRGYTQWVFHGESMLPSSSNQPLSDFGSTNIQENPVEADDMRGLITDAFRHGVQNLEDSNTTHEAAGMFESSTFMEGMNIDDDIQPSTDESAGYRRLLKDADEELYPGCTKFSKISFLVHLFHIKYMNGWSGKSFTMLLKLLKDAFPEGTCIPSSYYEAKKVVNKLDLGYEKIHSCPKDCMIYRGETADQESCTVCGSSRWTTNKEVDDDNVNEVDAVQSTKKPAKILRYFPLIPRLRRIYASSKTASSMRWHHEGRTKDGMLRHPADSPAWKAFDDRYPDFASEIHNVRLGLASDGFNPFRTMSSTYSTWPVVLIPYNLPPWMCMKQSSLILSTVIPGDKGPGNDIDIFLQPLIEELKQLWKGIDTFDASNGQTFKLRAALLWTINDFPAYANLSGWSTKGRVACPCCADSTHSIWLKHGGKFCYMGHRRWLEANHLFRFQKDLFDGTIELRCAPIPPAGTDVRRQMDDINYRYGKFLKTSKKRGRDDLQGLSEEVNTSTTDAEVFEDPDNFFEDKNDEDIQIASTQHQPTKQLWKKRSIFFDLPYWEYNLIRHNLDVMHIEKNVCDNLLGTLLNLDGKTKDNMKARFDLKEMGIRRELHPTMLANDRIYLPPACYTMSAREKENFLTVLKYLKVPDGYASNISRCVHLKDRKLYNLKSHDGHILMQDILPLALRSSVPKQVLAVVFRLSSFFKALCSKAIDPRELDQLESDVATTLCQMEKIFPPGFFTIMVHLLIHLVSEVKIGGPVHYRWMYPIERYLVRLKNYVRNRAYPEGSIAEGYVAEECLTFCSRYLSGVDTVFNRPQRHSDFVEHAELYKFSTAGRILGRTESIVLDVKSLAQAHRYVLLHSEIISNYRK